MTAVRITPRSDRAALAKGLIAAGPSLLVLVLAHTVSASPGFLEAISDGLGHLPLALVGAAISTFGPLAKGLLYLAIGIGVLLAGALAGWFLDRRLRAVSTIGDALTIAVAVFLIAELVVLPVLQGGFFGATTGYDPVWLHGPLAVASIVYGGLFVLLRRADTSVAEEEAGASVAGSGPGGGTPMARRTFVGRALAVIGGLSVLGAFATMGNQVLSAAQPRSGGRLTSFPPDSFGPTPALTPIPDFYVVAKDLLPPSVSADSWRLSVDGLVERPTAYSMPTLRGLPAQSAYRTLECISTEIVQGDHLIGNQLWKGVRISEILDRAGVRAAASWVLWEAADGYTESIPLAVARDPDAWIAYEMGGGPIPIEHGFPARVLLPGRFGMKQPKWVTRMHLATQDAPGYWEQRGWDEQAIVRTMSRIDFPSPGDTVPAGQAFGAYGIAYAGDRGISRVQVSVDGGTSWVEATLENATVAPLGPLTWVLWRARLTIARPGSARIVVRAADGTGALQSGEETPALPSGSTGWQAIRVNAVQG